MENISPEDILQLLENPERITTLSVFRTKLIADRNITGKLIIRDKNIKETVTFSNCSFEDVYIENAECPGSIEFRNCTFSNDFLIFSIYAHSILLENCRLEKSFRITSCDLLYLSFDRTEAANGIILEAGKMQIMEIKPVNEKTFFSISGAFLLIKELYITSQSGITITARKSIINNICLTGYFNIASRLDFNAIINKSIDINGLNNDGKIYLSNLVTSGVKSFIVKDRQEYVKAYHDSEEANESELRIISKLDKRITANDLLTGNFLVFVFRDFIEKNHYDDFVSYEEDPEIKFQIHDSSVGILELRSINFERYIIAIKNSDLTAVKLVHAKIHDVNSADNFLNYYNVYNDLYTTAAKQNNSKDKADYYKISQSYLNKYLKYDSTGNNVGSRIAIYVSRLFSSHGTDWIRACLVTISIAFIFFCLYISSLKQIKVDLSTKGIFFFFDSLLTYFPQFINPLHRIEFMSEISKLGNWTSLYDFLARIFVSIGAFEIVRSFRKHVR
ncbi:hypothetical protein [Flavobacterium flavigenum]|uniref:hypothetical protein n=1 Tax=Flavobacterium flavigenum TaxID=3003258 RepID=UPI002482FA93|nr:hypothetical protein [Flavobacterium flavigenum]